MFCHSCGAQLADAAKFCDACGAQTAAEQATILAEQAKNQQENPPAFLDLKTAVLITAMMFVILPVPCFLAEVPLALGFITAGVLGAIAIIMGIRNQFFTK